MATSPSLKNVPAFYFELGENNSRDWFKANAERYLHEVKEPIEELVLELENEFGAIKTFRQHRDVRFSTDKRPYSEHVSFACERKGGMLYFQMSAHEVLIAGGRWQATPSELAKFRAVVDDIKLIGDLREQLSERFADGLEADTEALLKTAPRGFSVEHPNIDLLRWTKLALMKTQQPQALSNVDSAAQEITKIWRSVDLWNEWLQQNIAPYTSMAEARKR